MPKPANSRRAPMKDTQRSGNSRGVGSEPRKRSRERFEKRREEVVDIAARLFAERGYDATSIDDLVEATGLQRGGLYHYIDGKKDLLIRIHERFIEPLLEDTQEIVERGETPEATLRLVARALMHDIATYNSQVTVFLHERRMLDRDPEWADIRKQRRRFEKLVEGVLEQGEQEGVFSIRDRRLARLAFLGMFNYSYQWYKVSGRVKSNDIADQFVEIYLGGIKAK